MNGMKLPGSVDVAIVGVGIIVCAAAWCLTKLGKRWLYLEMGRIAGEQSSRIGALYVSNGVRFLNF
jgi:glycine/D-amino acid oxidase-like deaminating enzyme